MLIVATSGGPEAAGLVDAAMLDALGPQGVIVNISRGSVIDEDALVAALADGRIAGAGLDVFAHEPHVPPALLAMDQVVLQPHQGMCWLLRADLPRREADDFVVLKMQAPISRWTPSLMSKVTGSRWSRLSRT